MALFQTFFLYFYVIYYSNLKNNILSPITKKKIPKLYVYLQNNYIPLKMIFMYYCLGEF